MEIPRQLLYFLNLTIVLLTAAKQVTVSEGNHTTVACREKRQSKRLLHLLYEILFSSDSRFVQRRPQLKSTKTTSFFFFWLLWWVGGNNNLSIANFVQKLCPKSPPKLVADQQSVVSVCVVDPNLFSCSLLESAKFYDW